MPLFWNSCHTSFCWCLQCKTFFYIANINFTSNYIILLFLVQYHVISPDINHRTPNWIDVKSYFVGIGVWRISIISYHIIFVMQLVIYSYVGIEQVCQSLGGGHNDTEPSYQLHYGNRLILKGVWLLTWGKLAQIAIFFCEYLK